MSLTLVQTRTQSAATKSPPIQTWPGGLETVARNLKSPASYIWSAKTMKNQLKKIHKLTLKMKICQSNTHKSNNKFATWFSLWLFKNIKSGISHAHIKWSLFSFCDIPTWVKKHVQCWRASREGSHYAGFRSPKA